VFLLVTVADLQQAFLVKGLPSVSNTFAFLAGNRVSPEMISSAWAADVPNSKTLCLFSGITTVHEYLGLRLRMRITSGRSQAALTDGDTP
jgi:hypothetical protein